MVRKNSILFWLLVSLMFCGMGGKCFADAAALFEQAEEYEEDANYAAAEAVYKQIVADFRGTDDGLKVQERLTCLYIVWEKKTKAEAAYQEMLSKYGEHEGLAKAVDHVADSYREAKKYEKARELYQYVVDTWPYADHTVGSHRGVVQTSIALGVCPSNRL